MMAGRTADFQMSLIAKIAQSGTEKAWHMPKRRGHRRCNVVSQICDTMDANVLNTESESSSNYYDKLSDNETDETEDIFQGLLTNGHEVNNAKIVTERAPLSKFYHKSRSSQKASTNYTVDDLDQMISSIQAQADKRAKALPKLIARYLRRSWPSCCKSRALPPTKLRGHVVKQLTNFNKHLAKVSVIRPDHDAHHPTSEFKIFLKKLRQQVAALSQRQYTTA